MWRLPLGLSQREEGLAWPGLWASLGRGGCEGAPHLPLLPWETFAQPRPFLSFPRKRESIPSRRGAPCGCPLPPRRGLRKGLRGRRGETSPPLPSLSLSQGERGLIVAAFSQSPAERRGRRGGRFMNRPYGGPCVAGGCGLRWALVVARGPLISIFSRGEKRGDPGGERFNVAAFSQSPAEGRGRREGDSRIAPTEVAGFDDPVRGRANACLTRPWRRRIVTTTNICSLRRETVEGALRTRRRLTSLPRRPGAKPRSGASLPG